MKRMKNHPLSVQIWIVFAIITLSISILLSFILPVTLRSFFTREIYATIDSAQDLIFNQFDSQVYRDYLGSEFFGDNKQKLEDIRTVNHFIIYADDNSIVVNFPIPKEFALGVKAESDVQKTNSEEYSGVLNGEKIFYIITKGKALNRDAFLVSFMGDSYREDLVKTLLRRLVSIVLLVFVFSWIPALLLSNYLTKPLVDLERKVKRIADNQWDEKVELNRQDEIGKLGESVEYLRNRLIRQDEAEQSFLQNVSHELKTPVMVIRSFAQAILDGIYPKGDLTGSIEVIDKEAETLENKIRNLLYMTKLDYIADYDKNIESFTMDLIIKEVVERFSWNRPDVKWVLDLEPVTIQGDIEQWKVAIENLLNNQLRYAETEIRISLNNNLLHIYNDGPPIDEKTLNNMFTKFNKGYKGEFGLGLAIVYKILQIHNSSISVKNEDVGVSFFIELVPIINIL